jgi:hypothetical protein
MAKMLRCLQGTARLLALGATLAGTAGAAGAYGADDFSPPVRQTSFFNCRKCPSDCPADSSAQQDPNTPASTAPENNTAAPASGESDEFGELGGFGRSYLSSGIAVAGSGLASASATGGGAGAPFGLGSGNSAVNVPNSATSPGFITSATIQPTLPMNRVFGGYSLFSQFQVQTLSILNNGTSNPTIQAGHQTGFDLNYFNIGAEKTIFNGNASIYVSVPFLSASDNTTGQNGTSTGQNMNGIGNVNFGFKSLLMHSEDNRIALSAGLTIAAPTAVPTQVTTTQSYSTALNSAGQYTLLSSTVSTVNPTYIQPWISGMVSGERFFAQNYLGFLVPTSDFVTSVNENLALGYKLWDTPASFTVSPIFNMQVLVPFSGSGINFSTQTFLTEGVSIGLSPRTSVFAGVTEPVTGPKAYTVGGTFGFNFLY